MKKIFFLLILMAVGVGALAQTTVQWIDLSGVTESGNILTKTAASGWTTTSGGRSSNVLPANTDGWVEFTITNQKVQIGFTNNDIGLAGSFLNAIQLSNSGSSIISTYEGSTATSFGVVASGDVFRISREGSTMKYYRNGAVIRSVSTNAALELYVRAMVYWTAGTSPIVTSSFEQTLHARPTITGIAGSLSGGTIQSGIVGGTPPYSYSWSTGSTTSQTTSTTAGNQTLTVTDAASRVRTFQFGLGYKNYWVDLLSLTENNGELNKVGVGGWNSMANGSNILHANTDGWLEFVAISGMSNVMLGMSTNVPSSSYSNQTAMLFFSSGGVLTSYEGNTATTLGTWSIGDIYRISREGSSIKYWKNGTVVRTVSTTATYDLRPKALLSDLGSKTPLVTTSFSAMNANATVAGMEGPSSTGSIALNPVGVSPFSYTWSNSQTTATATYSTPTNLNVTVADAAGRTQTATYGAGYKNYWLAKVGVNEETDGSLTKSAANGFGNGGAYNSNILPPNTDGWMEFVVSNINHYAVMGWSTSPTGYSSSNFLYGLYLRGSDGVLLSYENSTMTALGSWGVGDVFRISREGTSIKYWKNSTLIRTVSTIPAYSLYSKAALYSGSIPPVTTSYQNMLVNATVNGAGSTNGTGSIAITPAGGKEPFSYNWGPETTSTITNKSRGSYSVTVTDAAQRTLTKTYEIGYKTYWTTLTSVTENNGVLTRPSGTGWNAGAVSVNTLPANTDGWIEFVSPYNSYFQAGFATNTTTFSNTTFTHALRFDNAYNNFYTYEGSTQTTPTSNWIDGDVWRISREGSQVKYYRNGMLFRTVAATASQQLYVKVVLYSGSAPLINSSFWVPAGQGNVPDIAEFNALKDLYTSTAGANWTNKTGWPTTWPASATSTEMSTWFGVTVVDNDIQEITLSYNNLTGPLSPSIGNLQSLQNLNLSGNHLNGSLPASIGGLTDLRTLWLISNSLTGTIPSTIASLTNLTELYLSVNNFNGSIPAEMGSLSELQYLGLESNQLTGSIPPTLGNLSNCLGIYLQYNQLTGSIPPEIGSMPELIEIWADANQLTGSIPVELFQMPKLAYMGFPNNQLSGLPEIYKENTALLYIELNENILSGPIPDGIRYLPSLNYLSLGMNRFTSIPDAFAAMHQLGSVDVSYNLIEGPLPPSLSRSAGVNASNNMFYGEIPASWRTKPFSGMDLSNNNLSGSIPDAWTNIYYLRIANNNFTNIPALGNLETFNISEMADNYLDFDSFERNNFSQHPEWFFPQKKYNDITSMQVPLGSPFVINPRSAGQNGSYLYEKLIDENWESVNHLNQDPTNRTFKIISADISVEGKYRYTLTNTGTAQTLESEPFDVYLTDPLPIIGPNALFNGLITGMHWRTDLPAENVTPGSPTTYAGRYNFTYDAKYQIQEANYSGPLALGFSTNKFRLTNMSYDPNGNILTLKRYDELGNVQHDFAYAYANSMNNPSWTGQEKNQLQSVSGYVDAYTYNAIGQMTTEDKVDGEEVGDQFVEYDVTGKVRKVFSDALKADSTLKVEYTYDDRGFRLSKKNLATNRTTWYIRDASGNILSIYEESHADTTLTQTEIPVYGSGKLGTYYANQDGSVLYELTDHLGNVRAVVRDNVAIYTATMEDNGKGLADAENPRAHEVMYFRNVPETAVNDVTKNHTLSSATTVTNPSRSSYLFWVGSNGKSVGPSIALEVKTGDKIDLETWAQYETATGSYNHNLGAAAIASFLAGGYAYNTVFEGSTVAQTASAFQSGLGLFGNGDNDPNRPFAYMNYMVFNENLQVVKQDRMRIRTASENAYDTLHIPAFKIPADGYFYAWVSNETENVKVWFDDFKVTHTQVFTTQATDYGVWGDVVREQRSPLEDKYRFGYQGLFAEKDEETGWNHFELREYDAVIGRTLTIDPEKQFYSAYLWVGNNPSNATDPTGGVSPVFDSETGGFLGLDQNGWEGPILFMSQSQYKSIGGASGLKNIDATTLNLTSIENQRFSDLESWSNVITFLAGNKNIPGGLGLGFGGDKFAVGRGYKDENNKDITVESYLGGRFSNQTGMYVDAFNQGQMTVVVNMQGKLEAPIFFKGGVWDAINTTVHENDHRSIGPVQLSPVNKARLELRAIETQKAHQSWKKTSPDYKEEIQRYKEFNQSIIKKN
jgi:RHS repeat-associated protein